MLVGIVAGVTAAVVALGMLLVVGVASMFGVNNAQAAYAATACTSSATASGNGTTAASPASTTGSPTSAPAASTPAASGSAFAGSTSGQGDTSGCTNTGAGLVCNASGKTFTPPPGSGVTALSQTQLEHAAVIVQTGQSYLQKLSPTDRQNAEVIALMVAYQESAFRMLANKNVPASINLPHDPWPGSPDGLASNYASLGIFQQQTGTAYSAASSTGNADGWGTPTQLMDITYDTKAFYGGIPVSGATYDPKVSTQSGLMHDPDWQTKSRGVAAQDVQSSAFPDAYAQWETMASALVGFVLNIPCTPAGVALDGSAASTVVAAAEQWMGTMYCYGAGDPSGPTLSPPGARAWEPNPACFSTVKGFDCSGLALYAYSKIGVTLPHSADLQWQAVIAAGNQITDPSKLQPGDLIFFNGSDGSSAHPGHVGIVVGPYEMINAPESWETVQLTSFAPGTPRVQDFVGGGHINPPSASGAAK